MTSEIKPLDLEWEKKLLSSMRHVIMNGTLEELKPYFIDSEITKNEIYSDIQHNVNSAFLCAVHNAKHKLVEYLLTSPELTLHADIHANNDEAIFLATAEGDSTMVDYLLHSPNLKEHINIEPILDEVFSGMIENFIKEDPNYYPPGDANAFSVNQDIVDTIYYFVHDYKIKPTEHILYLLKHETKSWYFEPEIEQLEKNLLYHTISDKIENIILKTIDKKNKL